MSSYRRRTPITDFAIHGTGDGNEDTAKLKRVRDLIDARADLGKGSRIIFSGDMVINEDVSVLPTQTILQNAGGIVVRPDAHIRFTRDGQLRYGGSLDYGNIAGSTAIKAVNVEGQEWVELDTPGSLVLHKGDFIAICADNELTTPHSQHNTTTANRPLELHRILKIGDGNANIFHLDGFLKDQMTVAPRITKVNPIQGLVIDKLLWSHYTETPDFSDGLTFRGLFSTVVLAGTGANGEWCYVSTTTGGDITGAYVWTAGAWVLEPNSRLSTTAMQFRRTMGLRIVNPTSHTPAGPQLWFNFVKDVNVDHTHIEDKWLPEVVSSLSTYGYMFTCAVVSNFNLNGGEMGHCRHILTTGGANGQIANSRYGTSDGTVRDTTVIMTSSAINSNRPWDVHAEGWGWAFRDNKVFCKKDSQGAAFQTRGRFTSYIGNQIIGDRGVIKPGTWGPKGFSVGGPDTEIAYNTVRGLSMGGRTWSFAGGSTNEGSFTVADRTNVHHNTFSDMEGPAFAFFLGTEHTVQQNTTQDCAHQRSGLDIQGAGKSIFMFDHGSGHTIQGNLVCKYDNDFAFDMRNSTPVRAGDVAGNTAIGYDANGSPFDLSHTSGPSFASAFDKYNWVTEGTPAVPIDVGFDMTIVGHGLGVPYAIGEKLPIALHVSVSSGTVTTIDGTDEASAATFNGYLVGITDANTIHVILASEADHSGLNTLAGLINSGIVYYANANGLPTGAVSFARMIQGVGVNNTTANYRFFHAITAASDTTVVVPGFDMSVASHGLGAIYAVGDALPVAVTIDLENDTVTVVDGTDEASAASFNGYLVAILNSNTLRVMFAGEADQNGINTLSALSVKSGHSYYADDVGVASELVSYARMFQGVGDGDTTSDFRYFHNVTPSVGSDGGGGGSAAGVTFAPVGAISATDVQAALAELDSEKLGSNITTGVMAGATAARALNFGGFGLTFSNADSFDVTDGTYTLAVSTGAFTVTGISTAVIAATSVVNITGVNAITNQSNIFIVRANASNQAANLWLNSDADTGGSRHVGVRPPVGLAASYEVEFFDSLPAANSVVTIDASGKLKTSSTEPQTLTVGATIVYDFANGRNAELPTPGVGNTVADITNVSPGDEGQLTIQGGPNNPSFGGEWDFGSNVGWTLTSNILNSDIISWKIASNGKIQASVIQGYQSPF